MSSAHKVTTPQSSDDHRYEINPSHHGHAFVFTMTTGPIYALRDGVDKLTVYDQLSIRLTQLESMLQMTTGAGSEAFGMWSDDIRDGYLSACAMTAAECRELARLMV